MKHIWHFLALSLLLAATGAEAQIPRLLSFQGVLADSLGQPMPDGDYMVTFSLYPQVSGGSAAWIEMQTVAVHRGLFSTILGKQTLFYDSFKFDRPYWLGLRVGTDPEMTPRIELTAVGYSFSSIRSDTARYALAGAKPPVADSARIAGTIPDNAVTGAKVADGSLQRADVAAGFTAPYADTAAVARVSLQGGATDSVRIAGTIPNNTVTSAKILDGTIQRIDVQSGFKAPYADTADFARATSAAGAAGGDLTGSYPNPTIASGAVTGAKILDATIQRVDVAANFKAPYADTSDYARASSPAGGAGGDLSGTYPNPAIASGAVTGAKILDATIQRVDVAANFKAPYADTSDYAKASAPAGAAGGDLSGTYPNPAIAAGAVTGTKIASNAITTPKVAHGQMVKSLNGRTDSITIAGANGTTVATSNDTIYINSPGGSGSSGITGIQNTNNTLDVINPNGPTTTVNVKSLSIGATQLTDNGVTSAKIADGTITSADIADATVTSTDIADATVTSTDIANATIQRADVAAAFKAPYADTADYAKAAPVSGAAGGDLTGTYPNPAIAANAVTSAEILDATVSSADIANTTIQRVDVVAAFKAPYADTADYAKVSPPGGAAGGDLSGTYPNPAIATGAVTGTKILDGTIARADVQSAFKAPYADTADYAKAAPVSGAAGGDLTGTYPNPAIAANAVGSAEIVDGSVASADIADGTIASADIADGTVTSTDIANATIQRADVVVTFKAPYTDTADYAKAAPVSGAAGGDLTGTYPNPAIAANAVTSAEILDATVSSADIANATIVRADVVPSFKAPYADTADYAKAAPATGAAGGDLSGSYPNPVINAGAVTGAKILDGTIARADVQPAFKAPFADTADYARAAPVSGAAGGDLSGTYPNPSVAANAIGSAEILDGTVSSADIADATVTSTDIANATIQRADVVAAFKAPYADTADYAKAAPPLGIAGGDLSGAYPNPSIATGAVTNAKLAGNAVTTPKVAHGQLVKSLNGKTDSITIAGANGTTVTSSNDTLYINSPGGGGGGVSGIQNTNNTLDVINPNGPTTTVNVKNLGIGNGQLAANAVTTDKITDATIARADVAANFKAPYSDTADYAKATAFTGAAGGDLTGTYPNPAIAANAVTSAKILDGTVASADIADATVTSTDIANATIQRVDVVAAFKAPYADTADYAKAAPPGGAAGGDLSGTYPNPVIAANAVTSADILDATVSSADIANATIQRVDVVAAFKAPYADTADYAKAATLSGTAGGDLTGTYPNPTIGINAVTSLKIADGTVSSGDIADGTITSADIANGTLQRVDVISGFKAPYADTADYAKAAPASGGAGGDLSGTYPNPAIAANAVTSAKVLDGTLARADVQAAFKAPYSDTADFARAAPPGGSAGGSLTGTYPNPTIAASAVTSTMILNGTIARADVQTAFKAPYADTADHALGAPPLGSAGGDLTGSYPSPAIATGAVTGAKILDGTVARADVQASFKAPYADTADYAKAAAASGAAGGDLSGTYPNPSILTGAVTNAKLAANALTTAKVAHGQIVKALNGRTDSITIAGANGTTVTSSNDTLYINSPSGSGSSGITGIQNTNNTLDVLNPGGPTTTINIKNLGVGNAQLSANAVTTDKIQDATVVRADAAANFKAPYADTADYAKAGAIAGAAGGDLTGAYPNPAIASGAVTSAKILDGTITGADILDGTVASADITDATVTSTDIANSTIQRVDVVAAFKAPYADTADFAKAGPPTGAAGGDLTGTYPNPSITTGAVTSAKILDATIANADIANSTITNAKMSSSGASTNQALMYNGTTVTWGNPAAGSLALPFSGSASSTGSVLAVTNSTGSLSDSARALHGIMSSTTSAPLAAGVRGENAGTNAEGFGVWGLHRGAGYGVYGSSSSGRGLSGYTQTGTEGVYGQSDKTDGNGILGYANGGPNAWGVYGSNSTNGAGVAGFTGTGIGIYGYAIAPGLAGKFTGNVDISGTLSKGGGSFKIDHPLDPANKYLYHSFVESPDMKNIYDGVATLDASGSATVSLPAWFEALNKDFRYQLTPIGAPGPGLYIAAEVQNNSFRIAGGTAGMKVSWQVTGIRHDAFAEQNRIPVEQAKSGEERGKYLYPSAFGLPEEMGVPADRARADKDKKEKAKHEAQSHGGR